MPNQLKLKTNQLKKTKDLGNKLFFYVINYNWKRFNFLKKNKRTHKNGLNYFKKKAHTHTQHKRLKN